MFGCVSNVIIHNVENIFRTKNNKNIDEYNKKHLRIFISNFRNFRNVVKICIPIIYTTYIYVLLRSRSIIQKIDIMGPYFYVNPHYF